MRAAVPDEYPRLVAIWRSAVDATHHFLRPSDRDEIERRLAADWLPRQRIIVAEFDGRLVGFAGIDRHKLEMLFVDADHQGIGVGSVLLSHAVDDGIYRVDVNEDNGDAVAFYRRRGFVVIERTTLDDQGLPYPLLRMTRVAAPNRDPYPGRYLPPDPSSVVEDYFSSDQFPGQQYSRLSRRLTRRHQELLSEIDDGMWLPGRQALQYCLARLATSGVTEAWCVGVVDGWADTASSFRVVYRLGTFPATLGIRRVLAEPGHDRFPDGRPEWLGPEVADADIGEPLGSVVDRLRPVGGVHWWGDPD